MELYIPDTIVLGFDSTEAQHLQREKQNLEHQLEHNKEYPDEAENPRAHYRDCMLTYRRDGKLRKQTAFNYLVPTVKDEAANKFIQDPSCVKEFANTPRSGFRLVMDRYTTGSIKIELPEEEFQFDINVANLCLITSTCHIYSGGVLDGEFVFGWSSVWGAQAFLVPVNSTAYQKALAYTAKQNTVLDSHEFIPGNLYSYKSSPKYAMIFLGEFPVKIMTQKSDYYAYTNKYYSTTRHKAGMRNRFVFLSTHNMPHVMDEQRQSRHTLFTIVAKPTNIVPYTGTTPDMKLTLQECLTQFDSKPVHVKVTGLEVRAADKKVWLKPGGGSYETNCRLADPTGDYYIENSPGVFTVYNVRRQYESDYQLTEEQREYYKANPRFVLAPAADVKFNTGLNELEYSQYSSNSSNNIIVNSIEEVNEQNWVEVFLKREDGSEIKLKTFCEV